MKTEINGKKVILPDFLIVGAGKSGTTSLFRYLNQHPQIFIPEIKEPHFFSFSGEPTHFRHYDVSPVVWDFDKYTSLFTIAGDDQITGEASTTYLYYYKKTIQNIEKYVPGWTNIKIIIILRNPIERAESQYRMNKMNARETLNFEDAIDPLTIRKRLNDNWAPGFDYIGYGRYYNQVKAYVEHFHNVTICLTDDLRKDAHQLLKGLFRYLGVNDSFIPEVGTVHNPSGDLRWNSVNRLLTKRDIISSKFPPIKYLLPRKVRIAFIEKLKSLNLTKRNINKIKRETVLHLKDIYSEDILRLQNLIDRDLSHWLE